MTPAVTAVVPKVWCRQDHVRARADLFGAKSTTGMRRRFGVSGTGTKRPSGFGISLAGRIG